VPDELRVMLIAGLSVAIAGGVVAAVILYALSRLSPGPLFGPVGPVGGAPRGVTVLAAFAAFIVTTSIVRSLLDSLGYFQRVYGEDFPAGWPPAAAETIRYLWSAVHAFPIQLTLLLVIRSVQAGFKGLVPNSASGWARHAVAGYLTWLFVTPVAFCVFALANLAYAWLTGKPPDKHPLTALGNSGGTRDWAAFVLQTVLLAPILEELLFRGTLLPWLAQTKRPDPNAPLSFQPADRPLVVMLLSVGVAFLFHANDVKVAWEAGDWYGVAAHLMPGAFFLVLVPLDFWARRTGRVRRYLRVRSVQHARAIIASSALFAAVHSQVWPSPVPLFVLALGLGYLYMRTRSLVGPVVVHGMFNAVSAVYLLMGGPA
jgi:membrane protease YdiL (CAAX protease family)